MKPNFAPATALGIRGRVGVLIALVITLLLSGCVAPYGYDGYYRYRAGGYGYWDCPRYSHHGGYYIGSFPHGSLGHGFGGHRGFHGGGHYNHGGPH